MVLDGITGLFFGEQFIRLGMDCIQKRESAPLQLHIHDLVENSQRFSKGRFIKDFKDFVEGMQTPNADLADK